jgi:glutamate carboxypeptidase
MPLTPATEELANRAAAIYGELGLTLGRGGNGGASESALAAYAGVPALDGLGPVGGGSHSEDEYLELNSLTPRLYLLARLLMELGAGPPPR